MAYCRETKVAERNTAACFPRRSRAEASPVCSLSARQDSLIAHERSCPEANAQYVSERHEHAQQTDSQAKSVSQQSNQQRHHGAAKYPGAQDAGQGAVISAHRVESEREDNGIHDREKESRHGKGDECS